MSNRTSKEMTLAQFKRDAAAGGMTMEFVSRYGKTGDDIPERVRGERTVVRTNSVAVFLKKKDTEYESELHLTRAKLVKYTGDALRVYAPIERDPNEQEQSILDEWHRWEDAYLKENPFCETFWKMKDFFKASPCPYMSGFDTDRSHGKSYNPSTGKVRDSNIPGIEIMHYIVRHYNHD